MLSSLSLCFDMFMNFDFSDLGQIWVMLEKLGQGIPLKLTG
jgi:hypothetical protein